MKYFIYIRDTVFGIKYKRNTGEIVIGSYNKYEDIVLHFMEVFLGMILNLDYTESSNSKIRVYESIGKDTMFIKRVQVQKNKFRYIFRYRMGLFLSAINKAADLHTVNKVDSLQNIMR